MFHRTERLFLRPAWPEDWEAVLGGIADEGVVMNLARAPWPYGPEEAREFVSRGQDLCCPNFLLVRPDTGKAASVDAAESRFKHDGSLSSPASGTGQRGENSL